MASNAFGTIFRITTWGESHGRAIGVVIDGCPAGLAVSEDDIQQALAARAPGRNPYTSPRQEVDRAAIYSGVFDGITTGAPIAIQIANQDADPSRYESIKHLLRPGHANYTYTQKYGIFDYRGGGRASARETACRVAAGAVAAKLLQKVGIEVYAFLRSLGPVVSELGTLEACAAAEAISASPFFTADSEAALAMQQAVQIAKDHGDSLGGIVECVALHLPVGLGDPVYEKLEANLAKAMLSLPASKGFEIGEGFKAASMTGSTHNDAFCQQADAATVTNHAGGTLGGISSGMPLRFRVAFKPTSSIQRPQQTVDEQGHPQTLTLPAGSRHDPCVAIRAVPVVKAMCQLVLADALLLNQTVTWPAGVGH